ncbi:hypothetical protein [Saccharothrix hoggarensis]|uniref:Uncharacterized protein n=1 Tax=Saccharothrix hoggarensis TaxID=913853 RepID=A0ABW3R4U1_9PSEU
MTHTLSHRTTDGGVLDVLNTRWHRLALYGFLVVVVAHWVEHITQAVQIYGFGWSVPSAKGALGLAFPWLVTSEVMHYGFALVMLVALVVLRHGFTGRSRTWWRVALGLQFWHHIEHLLLIIQSTSGVYLLGKSAPTSIIQLVIPRVELHLFYNAIVFAPMVVAMVLHRRPNAAERVHVRCSCAVPA